jgi:putative transposase
VIRSNVHKYSISAMCKVLRIARSTYYYESGKTSDETELEDAVESVFNENRKIYGSRKIKVVLKKQGIILSRRKIIRIMKTPVKKAN